jgi:pilus assembly protein Flp/PilA
MRDFLTKQYVRLQTFLRDTHGQDLIEYALVVALIAFAATAGMDNVATDINNAFSKIGSKLITYTS